MRRAVVMVIFANLDGAVLAWAACVRNRIVCVVTTRRVDSGLRRRAAHAAVDKVAAECSVKPEWPPECSEAVSGR